MIHVYRCILDTKEDVIRDIKIHSSMTLEALHRSIVAAFEMNKGELASFYEVDDNWEQIREIPLMNMDNPDGGEMKDFTLKQLFHSPDDKMLYVYDFLKYWTFYVTLVSVEKGQLEEVSLVYSKGKMPESAPERHFEAEPGMDVDEAFDSDFDDLYGEGFDMEDFGEY